MGRFDALNNLEETTEPIRPHVSPTAQRVSETNATEKPKSAATIRPSTDAKMQTTERANAPTGNRPSGKRIITRNSFEIYEDQMESLRKLSYREKMDGKLGSMSGMVRDAIDKYLLKKPAA
jgi:hypothetical protein